MFHANRSTILLVVLLLVLPGLVSLPGPRPAGADCERVSGPTTPGQVNCPPVPELYDFNQVAAGASYHYGMGGGSEFYSWQVVSIGALPGHENDISIDQNGTVDVPAGACGSYRVIATNSCGQSKSRTVRIAGSGHWVLDAGASSDSCCLASGTPVSGCDDSLCWWTPCYCVASHTANPSPPQEVDLANGTRNTKVYGCMMCCSCANDDCGVVCNTLPVFTCGGVRYTESDPMAECTYSLRFEALSSKHVERWVCN